jgi:secreted trypsin-like serine protease
LPPQNERFDNRDCIATGWGKDRFGKQGLYQAILKKIELPTVSFNKCKQKLRKTKLGYDFILHESFMCAGGEEDIDTCTGDGGGPLVCPIKGVPDQYYQAGIVSWGLYSFSSKSLFSS